MEQAVKQVGVSLRSALGTRRWPRTPGIVSLSAIMVVSLTAACEGPLPVEIVDSDAIDGTATGPDIDWEPVTEDGMK
ncbi:MAG: hypothetical protein AAFX00_05995 [Pseudomonadota bacterium]